MFALNLREEYPRIKKMFGIDFKIRFQKILHIRQTLCIAHTRIFEKRLTRRVCEK